MMRSIHKLLLCLVVAGAVFALGSQAHAVPTDTGGGGPAPQPGLQVDVKALPQPAADSSKVQAIFRIVFGIIGALSLLMMTIGGFRYITSDGDPQNAAKAKGTVIFALVGLIVSISAVAIVTFVLERLWP